MARLLPSTCLVIALALSATGVWSQKTPKKAKWNECPPNDDMCICYDDDGCFEARPQCGEVPRDPKNPKDKEGKLPQSPKDLVTTFFLYDKKRMDEAEEMKRVYSKDIFRDDGGFDPKKDTKILINGVMSPNVYGSLVYIRQAFFKKDKYNIIMANWQAPVDTGSVDPEMIDRPYRTAFMNTRVVGREVGLFIKRLHDLFGVSYDSFHLVGHNLGAYVAGYAGKFIREITNDAQKLGRITALAPTAPFVEDKNGLLKPDECRLSKDDAKFTDAIHADRPSEKKITLGIKSQIGHADFYANEGEDRQPGCKYLFCDHNRPIELFEQSILGSCEFQSKQCNWTVSDPCPANGCWVMGTPCPAEGCPVMGTEVPPAAQGYFCVETTATRPFCKKAP